MTNANIEKRHRELMQMLPRFYDDAPEADAVMYADATEIERVRTDARDLLKQFTAVTATWGLSDWERVLELPPRPNSSDELRRARILAKLRGTQPATVANMLAIVNAHTLYNDAEIRELPEPGVVEFVINANHYVDMDDLRADIQTYIPAHLAYRIAMALRTSLYYGSLSQCGASITVLPYRPTNIDRQTSVAHGGITHMAHTVEIYPKGDE